MTYWNETNDSHIRFWNIRQNTAYTYIQDQVNEQGYVGDPLQTSKVVYLGTCDIMNLRDSQEKWSTKHHTDFYSDDPFIALGTLGSGLPSMVRRLYSYIQNYGAPKYIFMTIPRFDGYEFVNKSGGCYNVSSRIGLAKFGYSGGIVDNEERDIWLAQLTANRRLNNPENTRYILEERFAFIETLCMAHNIELKWTFNPSDASISVLYNNLPIFNDISDFMKNSFVGLPPVIDHLYDRSIGPGTHQEIYKKFVHPEKWDYGTFCEQATMNFNWLKNKYPNKLIMLEDDLV
jgi:hypothetical protein